MDFFLCGYLKQKVYRKPMGNHVNDLQMRIVEAVREINGEKLNNVYKQFRKRVEDCVGCGGEYVEYLVQLKIQLLYLLKINTSFLFICNIIKYLIV